MLCIPQKRIFGRFFFCFQFFSYRVHLRCDESRPRCRGIAGLAGLAGPGPYPAPIAPIPKTKHCREARCKTFTDRGSASKTRRGGGGRGCQRADRLAGRTAGKKFSSESTKSKPNFLPSSSAGGAGSAGGPMGALGRAANLPTYRGVNGAESCRLATHLGKDREHSIRTALQISATQLL